MAATVIAAALFLASCGSGSLSGATGGGSAGVGSGTAGSGTAGSGTASSGTVGAGTIGTGSSSPASSHSATPTPPSPTATGTASAPPITPPSGQGAYGYVTAGPTCPVERPDQPCPPQPVSARIDARTSSDVTVASTHSDSYGRYVLDLSPGSYALVIGFSSGWPLCPDTPITVQPGSATRADISCDTGIR